MKPEKKNRKKTSIPDNLKSGIENLSGQSMDDVKVHYSSDKPAKLQAHAYAKGTNIHLGAGQEKYLPHEAWHVTQQKQGRVKPNIQGLSKMSLYNNIGRLDENLPFHLFGPIPSKGSYLLFGSSEWLNKHITEITIKIFWEKDIPIDFARYYAAYPQDFRNKSFKVVFSIFKDGVWKSLNNKYFSLFEENRDNIVSHISTIILNLEYNLTFAGSEENINTFEYNDRTREGFIKMQLVEPEYGFGSAIYANQMLKVVINNAKTNNPKKLIQEPNKPYSPKAVELEVSISI